MNALNNPTGVDGDLNTMCLMINVVCTFKLVWMWIEDYFYRDMNSLYWKSIIDFYLPYVFGLEALYQFQTIVLGA